MGGVRVRHNEFGKRVVLKLGIEVQTSGALQIVEAIAVLELFELVLEHKVEGRAQKPAERHLRFGETTDPEVDVIETSGRNAVWSACPGAGTVKEGNGVRGCPSATQDNGRCGCALGR